MPDLVDTFLENLPVAKNPRIVGATLAAFDIERDTYLDARVWGWNPPRPAGVRDPHASAIEYGEKVDSALESLGLPLKQTPQGISASIVRKAVTSAGLKRQWKSDDGIHSYRRLRTAYLGGYTSVVRTWIDVDVIKIDRNSSYPAEISRGVPAAFELVKNPSEIHPDGIYWCRARVQDQIIPPLPRKMPNGVTAYPTGEFSGVWVGCELLSAQEDGTTILEIHQGWEPRATLVFPDIPTWYSMRKRYPWMKKILNSMAGILGRGEFIPVYRIGSVGNGWKPLWFGSDAISYRDVWSISPYAQPGGAAVVNARARTELRRIIRKIGQEHVVYIDTDCVVFDAIRFKAVESEISGDMGAWKIEKNSSGYACHALRRIRWGIEASKPPEIPSGTVIGGRVLTGTWTVSLPYRELKKMFAKGGKNE